MRAREQGRRRAAGMDDPLTCLSGEDGVPCHGNGEGVDNQTCVCYAGWTGKSDVLSYDGYDCMVRTRGASAAGPLASERALAFGLAGWQAGDWRARSLSPSPHSLLFFS